MVLLYIYLWEGIARIRLHCGERLYREGCRVDRMRSKVVGRLRGLSDLAPLVEYLRGCLYQGQSGVPRDAIGWLRRRCCPRLHWCTGTRHIVTLLTFSDTEALRVKKVVDLAL